MENVIHSKGWSDNGDVVLSCTALFINMVCSFWLLACCKILLCEYDPFIVIEHCSVNSNIGCVAHYLCNVPSENNYACESALKM